MKDVIVGASINHGEGSDRFPLLVIFTGRGAGKLQHGISTGLPALRALRRLEEAGYVEGLGNQGLLRIPVASRAVAERLGEKLEEIRFLHEPGFLEYPLVPNLLSTDHPFHLLACSWEEEARAIKTLLTAPPGPLPESPGEVGRITFQTSYAAILPVKTACAAEKVIAAVSEQVKSGSYREMAQFTAPAEAEKKMGMALRGDASWDIRLRHAEHAKAEAGYLETRLGRIAGRAIK